MTKHHIQSKKLSAYAYNQGQKEAHLSSSSLFESFQKTNECITIPTLPGTEIPSAIRDVMMILVTQNLQNSLCSLWLSCQQPSYLLNGSAYDWVINEWHWLRKQFDFQGFDWRIGEPIGIPRTIILATDLSPSSIYTSTPVCLTNHSTHASSFLPLFLHVLTTVSCHSTITLVQTRLADDENSKSWFSDSPKPPTPNQW